MSASAFVPRTQDVRVGARLIYLMGASGSGKDTMLRHVRARLRPDDAILIAHRYITRASSADEISLELAPEDFTRRVALGCFALHWSSHGLNYGIGAEIDMWMMAGITVIVNGSRAYLSEAMQRYPQLTAVEVIVSPDVLKARLQARGRESQAEIERRWIRATERFDAPRDAHIVRIENNGEPSDAANALLALARTSSR